MTGEDSEGECEGEDDRWDVAVVGVEAAEEEVGWLWVGVVAGVSTGVTVM